MASTKQPTRSRTGTADGLVREAIDSVGGATAEVEARLSDAAAATEAGVRAANESLRARSDSTLGLLGAFTVGMAAGLFLGGAHRILVVASLIPAILIGSVLLERMDRQAPTKSGRSA